MLCCLKLSKKVSHQKNNDICYYSFEQADALIYKKTNVINLMRGYNNDIDALVNLFFVGFLCNFVIFLPKLYCPG